MTPTGSLGRSLDLPLEGEGWVGVCQADGWDARLAPLSPAPSPSPPGRGIRRVRTPQ